MAAFQDLAGRKFGRLTALGRAGRDGGHYLWLCECECGRRAAVRDRHLKSGATRSCGCLNREIIVIHGHDRKGKRTPTYQSWSALFARCENPNCPAYPYYGGAGVRVCPAWHDFRNFLADMGPRPPGTTLSRAADSGDYRPGNVFWHTRRQQEEQRRLKNAARAA